MSSNLSFLANKLANKHLVKLSFIRKMPSGKWRVCSEKGKNLGEYGTKEEAKKRLRQIEFFKHKKAEQEINIIDLSDLKDLTYSAIMRELRQQCKIEVVYHFMQIFKKVFDELLLLGNKDPAKEATAIAMTIFSQQHEVSLPDA